MIPVVLFGKHTSSKGFRLNYPIEVLVLHKLMLMLLWTLEEEDVQRVFMYRYCLMKIVDRKIVISQFDWLCDVCGCVMNLTSDIYWINLSFINNYKEPQLWLILFRYNANVVSVFFWIFSKMIENMMKSDYEYMQFFFYCLSGSHDCAHLCYCY